MMVMLSLSKTTARPSEPGEVQHIFKLEAELFGDERGRNAMSRAHQHQSAEVLSRVAQSAVLWHQLELLQPLWPGIIGELSGGVFRRRLAKRPTPNRSAPPNTLVRFLALGETLGGG
jgi:hypothetical protein